LFPSKRIVNLDLLIFVQLHFIFLWAFPYGPGFRLHAVLASIPNADYFMCGARNRVYSNWLVGVRHRPCLILLLTELGLAEPPKLTFNQIHSKQADSD